MTDNRGTTASGMRAAAPLALVAAALALAGCAATMPAPSGLTAAPAAAVVYNRDAAFSVGVVPDRAPPVRLGEALGFVLSSSADGYGHLYLLNASGGVVALAENLPLAADARTAFPPPGAGYVFRATPPAGIERVLFVATRQPFAGLRGRRRRPGRRSFRSARGPSSSGSTPRRPRFPPAAGRSPRSASRSWTNRATVRAAVTVDPKGGPAVT